MSQAQESFAVWMFEKYFSGIHQHLNSVNAVNFKLNKTNASISVWYYHAKSYDARHFGSTNLCINLWDLKCFFFFFKLKCNYYRNISRLLPRLANCKDSYKCYMLFKDASLVWGGIGINPEKEKEPARGKKNPQTVSFAGRILDFHYRIFVAKTYNV